MHVLTRPFDPAASVSAAASSAAETRFPGTPSVLSLGAIAAGFGLFQPTALAQTAPPAASAASAPSPAAAAASAPAGTVLAPTTVRAKAETDKDSVRATTTTVGRGNQDLRDIPQSTTILTEKLLEDRRADTVKDALHYTAGITFQAAEGGEEDIRLRGFSLTASGDIYVDNVRDPAFYDRDVFNFDRIELLRGSASMLFGRGSTGGVVNQVSKQPVLANVNEISVIGGSGSYCRATGDFNFQTSETSALRLNVMTTTADNWRQHDRQVRHRAELPLQASAAPTSSCSATYYLDNDNGVNYGIPWLRRDDSGPISVNNPGGLVPIDPKNYYGAGSDYNAGYASYGTFQHTHRFGDAGQWHTVVRYGGYDRDLRASTIRFCTRATNPNTGAVTNPECNAVAPTQSTINDATHADPRHQQQGAGPDHALCPDRLQQYLPVARNPQRGAAAGSTSRARSSTTTT